MRKLLFALAGLLFLVSCQEPDTTETIITKKLYSIDLPSFLSKTEDLNDDASL